MVDIVTIYAANIVLLRYIIVTYTKVYHTCVVLNICYDICSQYCI